jgi:creatinine amidohydrolase
MRIIHRYVLSGLATAALAGAQSLPVKWEELTAHDFAQAIAKAQGACVLPFGIIEKHGPHLPLGTDLINARWVAVHGAEQEYAVVFPEYYFGQINEARQQPGTVAYSTNLQLQALQETADEMSRNGCKKILIVNGHGGNNSLLQYFGLIQLATPHDYVVYSFMPGGKEQGRPPLKSSFDMHAGEGETSNVMVSRPDLVHMDYLQGPSGDLKRLENLPAGLYTGMWWYARFPNHYAGDATGANKALGEFDMKAGAEQVAQAIRAVKADQVTLKLQNEFQEKAKHPLDTKQ